MSELIRVVIPRDQWVRGRRFQEFGYSKLLNERGNKCCLGHMGTACGVSDKEMVGGIVPSHLDEGYPPELFADIGGHYRDTSKDIFSTEIRSNLAMINDWPDIPDDIREAWIAEGFRRVGCEAVFVDSLGEANG